MSSVLGSPWKVGNLCDSPRSRILALCEKGRCWDWPEVISHFFQHCILHYEGLWLFRMSTWYHFPSPGEISGQKMFITREHFILRNFNFGDLGKFMRQREHNLSALKTLHCTTSAWMSSIWSRSLYLAENSLSPIDR